MIVMELFADDDGNNCDVQLVMLVGFRFHDWEIKMLMRRMMMTMMAMMVIMMRMMMRSSRMRMTMMIMNMWLVVQVGFHDLMTERW